MPDGIQNPLVRFYVKWADLKKSAEWRAEGTFARGTPEFERRNYLRTSAMEAYGYVAFTALIAILTVAMLIAILGERFG